MSHPDCLSSTAEDEDLSKPAPSSTITNSSAAESTSNASTMSVATNISNQEVPDEMFVEPTVNGNLNLGLDNTVPYSAESSGKSEDSKGLFKRNCSLISSNGLLIGKVVRTLQNSHSSCPNAEEERCPQDLPKNDSVNGAISLDKESKENGLKLNDSTCQVPPVKPSEIFFSKTNGLLETVSYACSIYNFSPMIYLVFSHITFSIHVKYQENAQHKFHRNTLSYYPIRICRAELTYENMST